MQARGWRAGAALACAWLLVACGSTGGGSGAAPTAGATVGGASPARVASASAPQSPAALPSTVAAASPSALASPSVAAAVTGPAQHVNVLWAAKVANMAPVWLAQDAGYFAEQGLDVDLSYVNGSGVAMAALIAGSADVVELSATAAITAAVQETGADARPVMFIGTVNKEDNKLMTQPSITDVSQLKGKTFCVGELGSFGDIALRLTLKQIDLDPTNDVSVVRGGSIDGCVASLLSGQTQAFQVSTPQNVTLVRQGMKVLLDTQTLNVPLQELGVATTRAYEQAHPDTLMRFTRAYIEAIHRWKTDKAFAEDEMRQNLGYDDPDELEDAYNTYLTGFEEVPLLPDQALQNEIDTTQGAENLTPDDVRDQHFVQQVQQAGFIQQVYGD